MMASQPIDVTPALPKPARRSRPRRAPIAPLPNRIREDYGADYFDRKMREAVRSGDCHELGWSHRLGALLAGAQARLNREEIETLIGAGASLKDAFLTVRAARRAKT